MDVLSQSARTRAYGRARRLSARLFPALVSLLSAVITACHWASPSHTVEATSAIYWDGRCPKHLCMKSREQQIHAVYSDLSASTAGCSLNVGDNFKKRVLSQLFGLLLVF